MTTPPDELNRKIARITLNLVALWLMGTGVAGALGYWLPMEPEPGFRLLVGSGMAMAAALGHHSNTRSQ